MKDEAINNFINEMTSILKSTKGFVLEQAPDIFNQILAYNLISSIVLICICILVLLIVGLSIYFSYKHYLKSKATYKSYTVDYMAMHMFVMIITIVSFFSISTSIFEIIKIKTAPKIYLLEYFSSVTKGRCK